MLLTHAHLVNVCQHVDVEVPFGPGIVAITGPNGSGKSNLVGSIAACITGDFSSLGGKKDQNVYRNKGSKEPAYIETTWQVPAGELVIRRSLAGPASRVSLNGKKLASGKEREVTDAALKHLNTTASVLTDYSFADYSRLREVVDGNKSARAKLFTSLCGVEKIERIDRAIKERLAVDRELVAEFCPEELDEALLRWSTSVVDHETLVGKQQSLAPPPDKDAIKAAEEKVASIQAAVKLIQESRGKLTSEKDRLRKAKQSLPVYEQRLARNVRLSGRLKQLVSICDARLGQLRVEADRADRLDADIAAYCAAQATLEDPQPAEVLLVAGNETEVREKIAALKEKQKHVSKCWHLLKSGKKDGDQIRCKTCNQVLDLGRTSLGELQVTASQLKAKIDKWSQHLQQITNAKNARLRYERDLDRWKVSQQAAIQRLTELAHVSESMLSQGKRDLDAEITRCDQRRLKFSKRQETVDSDRATLIGTIAATKQRIEQGASEVESIKQQIASAEALSSGDLDMWQLKLEEMRDLRDSHRELTVDIAGARQTRLHAAIELRKKRAARRRVSAMRHWMDVCERAKAICHRDRLPASIVRSMLGQTTKMVNEYLEQFLLPFQVTVDPAEFAFTVIHDDQTTEPASRLSTGQSLCLGIAFWLARASVFHGQLPFFSLDEPTANLDTDRVTSVADVIRTLANSLHNQGKQGIVITHSDALAASATKEFQLV